MPRHMLRLLFRPCKGTTRMSIRHRRPLQFWAYSNLVLVSSIRSCRRDERFGRLRLREGTYLPCRMGSLQDPQIRGNSRGMLQSVVYMSVKRGEC